MGGLCVSRDGASAEEPLLGNEVENESLPTEETGGWSPQAGQPSLALFGASRIRPPNKLILGSYVKLLEWSRSSADASTLDQEAARLLVRKCNPFEKRDSPTLTASTSQWWFVLRSTPSPSLITWIRGPISMWRKTGCIFAITTSMRRSSWYGSTSNV